MTIQNKLRATLVALFLFIIGLVGLNFVTFEQLDGDSPAVNASGSLRMRAYQLAWLSARLVPADGAEAAEIRRMMQQYMDEYEHILTGLEKGDEELHLVSASDEGVRAQLQAVRPRWEEYASDVRAAADAVGPDAKYAANAKVAETVASYVDEVDRLVMAYDDASRAKIAMSKKIELVVIVLALVIFVTSSLLIIKQVLIPLAMLTRSFREAAGKEGDLRQRLNAERYDEIGRIVHSFNRFVSDLQYIMTRAQECSTEVSGLSDTLWQASLENSKAVEYNAVAITNLAGHTNELNEEIQLLAASVAGISAHMTEMQALVQTDEINRSALLASIEAVRACVQMASASAEQTAHAAQEIAGASQDSAAAIEQQTASLDAFAATAEHLKGLAAQLDALVGRFKV
jgi:chemotaxis signal transduction protein cheW